MKDYDHKLKLLSLISEKILSRSTAERYRLMYAGHSKSKKMWIPMVALSVAAVLLLSVVTVLLIPLLTKQIPVYTGMTISSATENAVLDGGVDESRLVNVSYSLNASDLPTVFKDPTKPGGEGEPTKEHGHQKDPFDEIQASQDMYVAKSGETVRITIHFDNPKQYEILSFTINGIKYGSHMFLQGSNMENLIVEYEVPADADGVLECTIDAIKYIDGTQIKDVKIGGDQTIQILVYRIYSITYELGDDVKVLEELPTFYYKDLDTPLSAGLQKLGCIFEGWTYEGQRTPVMSIPKGTTGDLVLKPAWHTSKEMIDYLRGTLGGGRVIKEFESRFESGRLYILHSGVDIAVNKAYNVVAIEDGTVTQVSINHALGEVAVKIALSNSDISVVYHNLNSASVEEGDVVKRGDVIGIVGESVIERPTCSSEPCLHVGMISSMDGSNGFFDPYP